MSDSVFFMALPSQCPKCGAIAIKITTVPPDAHKKGENWRTRADCQNCNQYGEWGEHSSDSITNHGETDIDPT